MPGASLIWSAIASGFLTSIVPIGLAEAAALAFGAVQPPSFAITLFALFTVSHVAGKIVWYWLGTESDRVTVRYPRTQKYVAKARAMLADHPVYGAGILASAAVASVPPFHIASIAAGIARVPLWRFVAISLTGRAIRFGLIGAVPSVWRAVFD
jgi:membrane protein YqaA with SNARE-associated domain